MSYTRNIEAIQRDIIYLLNEKKGFFESLFHSNEKRLEALREEEWSALSLWLYTVDEEYKQSSDTNIELLSDTHWKLKIVDCRNSGKSASYTSGIKGIIQAKGFLHGEGLTGYLIHSETPPYPSNYVDALGNLQMLDIKSWFVSCIIPKAFNCYTNKHGIVSIETVDQEYHILYNKPIIGNVLGDPFNGNSAKRSAFLRNRQWLIKAIRKHTVKPQAL